MVKPLMKVDEVAEILDVDRQRVCELVRTGMIPVIKLGERQYRFSKSAIDEWLGHGGNLSRSNLEDNADV